MRARRNSSRCPGSTGSTSRCSRGIDLTRDILIENTERFAKGLPANNALLWGARGMGKSSLVKAAHHAINEAAGGILKLVEIHREDIESLPRADEHHPPQPGRTASSCSATISPSMPTTPPTSR